MDMTPMIDVVFLMIIFFMIVSDLTQQDLADSRCPIADRPRTTRREEGRMIVNILTGRRDRDQALQVEDPRQQSAVDALRNYLSIEVQKGEKEERASRNGRCSSGPTRTTEFKHVQKVMRICGENGIRIYKIAARRGRRTSSSRESDRETDSMAARKPRSKKSRWSSRR